MLAPLSGETVDSAEVVVETVEGLVGDEPVGRAGYSDRDPGGTEHDGGRPVVPG